MRKKNLYLIFGMLARLFLVSCSQPPPPQAPSNKVYVMHAAKADYQQNRLVVYDIAPIGHCYVNTRQKKIEVLPLSQLLTQLTNPVHLVFHRDRLAFFHDITLQIANIEYDESHQLLTCDVTVGDIPFAHIKDIVLFFESWHSS